MSEEQTENTMLLSDGRVMKGNAKIESIVTRYEERVTFSPYSLQCNRMLRRDFNPITAKMYMLHNRRNKREKIGQLIMELTHEANHLEQSTSKYPAPSVSTILPLPLRLISSVSRQLLEAMMTFDKAFAKVADAEGDEAAKQYCSDFFLYYGRLKHCLFDDVPR
jgi:hypothetical protein